MAEIRWKLQDTLHTYRLKPSHVEQEAIRLGYTFGQNSVYRLLQGDGPSRFDRNSLTALVHAIRSLSGQPVEPGDLFEFVDAPPPDELSSDELDTSDLARELRLLEQDLPEDELEEWFNAFERLPAAKRKSP